MSAKTTGGRPSLSLNSTGKMNHKPSTPNSVSDNNRGKELGNQKTEGEKSMKEAQQSGKDKKSQPTAVSSSIEKKIQSQNSTESNPSSSSLSAKKSESSVAKNSSQIDEKKSQNGVNSSGNTKNQNSMKSDSSSTDNKQKQDKTVDKNKSQNIQQQQQNSSSTASAEKSSEKVEANIDKKQDTSNQSDFDKTPRKNADVRMAKSSNINSPKVGSTAVNNDVDTTKGKNMKDEDKKDIQVMKASQINAKKAGTAGPNAPNENTNGTSTPTRNRRKAESTPDSKSKQSESVKAKIESKIVSHISTPSSPAADELPPSGELSGPEKLSVIDIDDVEMMDPLIFATDDFAPMAVAASTPGKIVKHKDGPPKSEQKATSLFYNLPWSSPPERKQPNYTKFSISGRRSIHPTGPDYKSMQGNYRRTKTDLDISCNTNTSLNVTVGSEAANNSSFSFFSRKRDRTPANSRSELELMADNEISPKSPKRPRIDVSGIFSAVASPLTMLRARFSRAAIQSSTPVKENQNDDANAEEVIEKSSNTSIDNDVQFSSDDDVTVGKEETDEPKTAVHPLTEGNKIEGDDDDGNIQEQQTEVDKEEPPTSGTEQIPIAEAVDEILVTVTPNKKRANCNVM